MNKLYKTKQSVILCITSIVLLFFCCSNLSFSQEYNSSNFKILDPVITGGGGYSSSADYKLNSSISQIGIGTSSIAGFNLNSGFLYFPFVTTPIISSTAGNGQVALSWTIATGVLGWTASGYDIGVSTVSGGPYTFDSSLGNVLSTVKTGLVNGTPYYFVVRVEDAFGNIIATSTQTSATPVAPVIAPGGGGGGGGFIVATTITFSGKSYPKSPVTLLKDSQIISTAIAGTDGSFLITLTNLVAGNYIFSMYSEDKYGNRSSLLTFPASVTYGATINVNGILIAPTVAVNKLEVKKGDDINIFGQSISQSDIIVSVHSNEEYFLKTVSDKDGIYSYNFNTSPLDLGSHITKSKTSISSQLVSSYSNSVSFKVGTQNVMATSTKACPVKGDLNGDCRVNLVDFSIASYWYKGALSDAFKQIEIIKLNGDGKINLIDFSIMAYYWTG